MRSWRSCRSSRRRTARRPTAWRRCIQRRSVRRLEAAPAAAPRRPRRRRRTLSPPACSGSPSAADACASSPSASMNPFQCSSTAGALPWISNHVSASSKRAAMHQRALGARRHFEIGDARLQRQQLSQPLRIAAGNRQHANLQDRLLRRPAEFRLESRSRRLPGRPPPSSGSTGSKGRRSCAASGPAGSAASRAAPDCAASPAPTRTCADRHRARRARPTAPGSSRLAGSPA